MDAIAARGAGRRAGLRRSFSLSAALWLAGAVLCAPALGPSPARAAEAEGKAPTRDQPSPLTLEQLLAEVAQRSPVLAGRSAELRAAAERPAQARAFEDPMLMVELWQVPVSTAQLPLMVTLRQPLPWPGKLAARAKVATHEVPRAQAELATSARGLRLEAARVYFDHRLAVRSLAVLGEMQKLMATIVAAVEIRYRVGRAELAELLKAQEDAATLGNLLLDVESEREVTATAINVLRARPAEEPVGTPVTSPAVQPLPPLGQLTELALLQRSELAGVRAALAQAQARQQAARSERAPDLAVWAGYMAMLRGSADHTFTVGVQTSVPSFSLLKQGAAAREAQALSAAQSAQLAQTEARIRGEVRTARLRVETAERHLLLHSQTLLPTAARAVQAAQAGYQSGRVPITLLLDAARMLAEHRLSFERFQAEYGLRRAELEAAIEGAIPEAAPPRADRGGDR